MEFFSVVVAGGGSGGGDGAAAAAIVDVVVVGVCLFKLVLKFHTCTHTLTPYSSKSFKIIFVLMLSNDGFIFFFSSLPLTVSIEIFRSCLYVNVCVQVCVFLYENLLR